MLQMLTAITRAVSPAIVNCELSFIDRKQINLMRAREQHHAYEKLLESLGARLVSLPAEPDLPDSMFVEDPAIVLDEALFLFLPSPIFLIPCLSKIPLSFSMNWR